jgi:two-component SAPR family response regulator
MNTKNMRILIIDDDLIYAEKLKFYLSTISDDITLVDTVARGSFILSKTKTDFVFLDNQLPRINGLEAIQFFKDIHPNVKIILMSSHFDAVQKEEAKENNVDFIFDKQSFTKQEVINCVLGNKC